MLLRIIILLLFPVPLVFSQELLQLSFAEGRSPASKVYGTVPVTTVSVSAGQQVVLQKSSGRDYRLQASEFGRAWTQVQQVPRNATAIAVTPRLSGTEVLLEVTYSNVEGDEALNYSSSIKGELDSWIPLYQSAAASETEGARHYSTAGQSSQLSVRVERAR